MGPRDKSEVKFELCIILQVMITKRLYQQAFDGAKGLVHIFFYSLHTLFDVATTIYMHCMPVYNTIFL